MFFEIQHLAIWCCCLDKYGRLDRLDMVLQNALPDVLCVVQVALEGAVSKKAALNSLAQGNLPQVCMQTDTQTAQQSLQHG